MADLEAIDTSLISVGKPTDGGCVYVSFAEKPTLPTSASQKMSEMSDFESVGEISENGFTESKSVTSSKFSGWHGGTVLTAQQSEDHTFKLEFLEVARPVVAAMRFGKKAVTEGEDGSVASIKPIIGTEITVSLVIDELESNGMLRRTVIDKATIESFDDVPHQRGSLMVYGCTFTAIDPGTGIPFEVYRAKPVEPMSASAGSPVAKISK